jgi:hypothetical protein
MTTDNPLVLVFAAALSIIATVYGILCIVSPSKMIETRARTSTLLSTESANDRYMIWQYRIMGAVFVIGGLVFLLLICGAALNRLHPSQG